MSLPACLRLGLYRNEAVPAVIPLRRPVVPFYFVPCRSHVRKTSGRSLWPRVTANSSPPWDSIMPSDARARVLPLHACRDAIRRRAPFWNFNIACVHVRTRRPIQPANLILHYSAKVCRFFSDAGNLLIMIHGQGERFVLSVSKNQRKKERLNREPILIITVLKKVEDWRWFCNQLNLIKLTSQCLKTCLKTPWLARQVEYIYIYII